jgi:predicted peptidase
MELRLDGGDSLRYSLHVPKIPAGDKVPLLLALHYGGEVTPYYSMHFLKTFALPPFRQMKCIIIAPDCPGRGWTDPLSEKAVLALVNHALASWPVDPDRTAVTGFSMGGTGTWFMASRHPGLFRAAVPVAGRPAGEPDPAVPIYAIHSRQDEIVELEPAELAVGKLREMGGIAELELISGATHYQTPRFVVPLITAARWVEHIWSGADYDAWRANSGGTKSMIDATGRPRPERKTDLRPEPEKKPDTEKKDY